jgi:hypothetical protein
MYGSWSAQMVRVVAGIGLHAAGELSRGRSSGVSVGASRVDQAGEAVAVVRAGLVVLTPADDRIGE